MTLDRDTFIDRLPAETDFSRAGQRAHRQMLKTAHLAHDTLHAGDVWQDPAGEAWWLDEDGELCSSGLGYRWGNSAGAPCCLYDARGLLLLDCHGGNPCP